MRVTWMAPTPCPDCGSITRVTNQHGTLCIGCARPMSSRAAADPDSFFTRADAEFLAVMRIRIEPEI
jgi:hypothetical protein